MKSNQGEFMQLVLAFLVLFLHRIPVFGDGLEIDQCNRSCGSRTVPYPFSFSRACGPYMLDRNCSESGDLYLQGFPVLDFTNSSIIIQPRQWKSRYNKSICNRNEDILNKFKPQFGLTSRNLLLFSRNCTKFDINFNITDLNNDHSRETCSTNIPGSSTSFRKLNNTRWFPWKSLENYKCKNFLSFLSRNATLELDKLELGWWMNGTCRRPNSCSANANCSEFQNPNNEIVHICHCNEGFEGDGFSEGSGCLQDPVNTPAMSPSMPPSRGKKFPVLVGAICGK